MRELSVPAALAIVLLVSLSIGLAHGLLITRLRLQPFVVTLCGLLLYRGIARYLTNDQTLGFADKYDPLRYLSIGQPFSIPLPGADFKLAVVTLAEYQRVIAEVRSRADELQVSQQQLAALERQKSAQGETEMLKRLFGDL